MDPKIEAIFFEIHRDIPREGPGSAAAMARALSFAQPLPNRPRVLDVGCGPGLQTLELARLTGGQISAIDTHQPYLDHLRDESRRLALTPPIQCLNRSMYDLDFPPHTFDLIWSEGSVYIMGFENGLTAWKPVLKPGGFLAVSELCWFRNDAPRPVMEFWKEGYPAMTSVEENLAIIRRCGYELAGHFSLPDNDWWDDYYRPIEKRLVSLKEKYTDDPLALDVLAMEEDELNMHRQYSAYYGYEFFVITPS